MIEEIITLVVAAIWALVSAITFVGFLWTSGKRRGYAKIIGKLTLWIGGIFSAGSIAILIDVGTWKEVLLELSSNAGTVRLCVAITIWMLGTAALVYTWHWFKERLG